MPQGCGRERRCLKIVQTTTVRRIMVKFRWACGDGVPGHRRIELRVTVTRAQMGVCVVRRLFFIVSVLMVHLGRTYAVQPGKVKNVKRKASQASSRSLAVSLTKGNFVPSL
jgi:hypothetical protein